MLGEKVMAKHLLDLNDLKSVLDKLNLKALLLEASNEIPLHTLCFEIPDRNKDQEWNIFLSYLPTTEHEVDIIKLMQVYVEVVSEEDLANLNHGSLGNQLNNLNNVLLFGKYGIVDHKIVYRYILTIPQFFDFDQNYFKSWLKMLVYNLESGLSEFSKP